MTVPAGSVFGLLGPNGAGKTTLIRTLVGFLHPDEGEIVLAGCARHQVGYLPERPHFPQRFKVREYLRMAGQTSEMDGRALGLGVTRVLELTGLQHAAEKRIGACSKGMLQRLGLAQALLADPPLLLLDEPFSGLDPTAQVAMRELIRGLNQIGKTIVLSTHRLSDVNDICTDIAILSDGRLARCGRLGEVLAPRSQVVIHVDSLSEQVVEQLTHLHPDIVTSPDSAEIVLPDDAMHFKAQALRLLLDAGVDVYQLERQRATLEEIYLEAVRS